LPAATAEITEVAAGTRALLDGLTRTSETNRKSAVGMTVSETTKDAKRLRALVVTPPTPMETLPRLFKLAPEVGMTAAVAETPATDTPRQTRLVQDVEAMLLTDRTEETTDETEGARLVCAASDERSEAASLGIAVIVVGTGQVPAATTAEVWGSTLAAARETTGETTAETRGETRGETIGETTTETTGETTAETTGETTAETTGETTAETGLLRIAVLEVAVVRIAVVLVGVARRVTEAPARPRTRGSRRCSSPSRSPWGKAKAVPAKTGHRMIDEVLIVVKWVEWWLSSGNGDLVDVCNRTQRKRWALYIHLSGPDCGSYYWPSRL
jgi:hypothetical protein